MGYHFSAHLGFLFKDLPLEVRFEAAAAAGFDYVEHPSPFELPAKRFRELLDQNGLRMAQMSSGNGGAGLKGLAALADHTDAFREGYLRAADYAEEVGSPFLHPMAGLMTEAHGRAKCQKTWLENVLWAHELLKGRTLDVIVEPISEATFSGYFLSTLGLLEEMLAELPEDIYAFVDIFHAACNREDACAFMRKYADRVGHLHVADHPGRHEPGTGEIDFAPVDRCLKEIGFTGCLGLEYHPMVSTKDGLIWRDTWPKIGTKSAK